MSDEELATALRVIDKGFTGLRDDAYVEIITCLRAKIAAHAAGREGGEWQDIDTAPKDGTIILIWAEDFEYPILASWQEDKHHLHKRRYWGTGDKTHWLDLYAADPTHWMHLPQPPLLAPQADKEQT